VSLAVIVPVFRAGAHLPALLASLAAQRPLPDEVWIAETEPDPATAELATRHGARYLPVARTDFDHAGTRSLLARSSDADLLVLLSQDACPLGPDALRELVRPLEQPGTAAAFGRQIAPPGAHPFVSLKRAFLYPSGSRLAQPAHIQAAGFEATFFSNAFAAYKRDALAGVGYFGTRRLMCEDVTTAAALLLAGHALAYAAEARVQHANTHDLRYELRRYFDIGACHAHEPWLARAFGTPSRAGRRYVRFGLRYLSAHGHARLVPLFLLWSAAKQLAYSLGRRHAWLSPTTCARLSSLPGWWQREAQAPRARG
jgi:rhamnosyltransferase